MLFPPVLSRVCCFAPLITILFASSFTCDFTVGRSEKEKAVQPAATDSVISDLTKVKWSEVEKLASANGELAATYRSGETVVLSRKAYLPYALQNNKVDLESTGTFTVMEVRPEYPGGEKAWLTYLKNNVHVSGKGSDFDREHVVDVQFKVDVEGNISDVSSRSRRSDAIMEEAIRLVKESGKWNPGIQNFRVINASITQRITIKPSNEVLI